MFIKLGNHPYLGIFPRLIMIFLMLIGMFGVQPIQSVRATTSDFTPPSAFSNSTLANPGNAFASDDQYTQSSLTNSGNNKKSAEYGDFGFVIPADATINRIEVSIEGHGTKNWNVAVSKDNGASYSAYATITNTVADTTTITSGPGILWGLTNWTADSLTDANFKVKVASAGGNGANIAYLDQLTVQVIYTLASAEPTTLVITVPPAGTYGGSINLTATLTSGGVPLPDQQITFFLNGSSRGTGLTNASGIATLSNVDLTTGSAGTFLNVGHYANGIGAIFFGNDNYAYSTDTETLKVNARPITITADPQTKVYGSDDPNLTYQITTGSLVGSDAFSGALTRAAGENVGTHAITQGTLTLSSDYTLNYIGDNLTITPLGLTVTADNKSVRLNEPLPVFTFGTSRFVGADTFITSPTCTAPDADVTTEGIYTIVCAGADAGSNYTISYIDATLIVTDKIILTVTANPQTKTYGDADPVFTFSYNGFVDGDDENDIDTPPTCGMDGAHVNVGSYNTITCGGGFDDKYAFSYVSGTLTINPRAVTVKADAKSKTYGNTDPALTVQVINGSLAYSDTFSGALTRAAGENVGTYAITQGTLTLGSNYLMNYVGDNLTVNKAPLTVTADDQTIRLGAADPVFTFEYDGFVNGEASNVINIQPTCGVSGTHTGLGTYPIVCSGGSDNNYSFSYVNGTLMILPMISGNVGIGGATLSYVNNGIQSVTSDSNGNYSILMPVGWSGTVTPSLPGYRFTPQRKSYLNLQSNQINQNYTAEACAICVAASLRANPNPTAVTNVDFVITFTTSVIGVDFSDFALTTTNVTGASITNVSGSGDTYTVTVNTGSGNGTIRLDVVDDDSIMDGSNNPLGGVGAGNGDFTSGEVYDVNKTMIASSVGADDGWILESTETSNTGGSLNKTATTLWLGDNVNKKQYRAILSFNTSSLPDDAIITTVTLKFKHAGFSGTNPFDTHGKLLADICAGPYKDNRALQLGDFNVACSKNKALIYSNIKVNRWYIQTLNPLDFQWINLEGVTQFRLRFAKDDNNNSSADFLKLYSGNAANENRPKLVIEYYVP